MSDPIHRPTIDEGYGKTPEEALGAVLFNHPMFDPAKAEYVSDRPEFMSVAVKSVTRYDWKAHESPERSEEDTDAPTVSINTRGKTERDDRIVIGIDDIVLRVQDPDDQSMKATFRCSIMLDETRWEQDDPVDGTLDKTWNCVLIGSELC